ncbi:TPM domain-containing protein [Mycobacterium sp. CVI_P3]|uniref:TPM domain-containing protein n=1 Tax=Mycobacterium pinniadriaticum TaxID=2994102 RepID=A0ABT3SD03_9MYCO|nr:TPM domain-containing protein [Mycobacterium pinniadriaticum]MCX2930974.1 TPM domain-containing protein [Mycobacterium pinniadriaticum]MCX2937398.1 TPM domain-containing protein [Mycobacterium pinniadriaticum]
MRLTRVVSLLAAILTAVTLMAPVAAAEPPFRLPDYVTDNAGVLSQGQLAKVQHAVDTLYRDRHVRLWVVYVDSFAPETAVEWAEQTRVASDLSSQDAILAVATQQRSYAFLVPSGATGVSPARVDDLRRDQIEPALHTDDWADAAIAAANGLATMGGGGSGGLSLVPALITVAIIVLAIGLLVLWSRRRRRKRHEAEVAAAKRVDPTDPNALAAVSLDALDELSRSIVVDVDNAMRTSSNELVLATEEFGEQRTEPFTKAVENAKITLQQAFNVRQQLDDAIPETPAQRRDLLTRVVVAAARANRELDTQTQSFHQLRDLVINAPDRLDVLTRKLVDVSARIDPAQSTLTQLHNEFAESALASVARNVNAARERVDFADHSISRARELVAKPIAGEQSELVDCVRAAEAALQQTTSMLDAVDSAASDIRRAVTALPSAIADTQQGINQAVAQLSQGGLSNTAELTAARDAAVKAVSAAQTAGTADPLGTFTQLTQADADLDRLLAGAAEERETAERLGRSYDQALFTAQSRVRSVSDYIDTRRGSVGPEARTRLNEAVRQLEAAQAKRKSNVTEAIAHANGASMLAAQAQQLANNDVQSAQRSYMSHYGGVGGSSNMGAVIGGIILGNILSGGMRGGFGGGGGWTSSTYGGSQGSSGGGGMFGGGGRF